MLKIGIDIVEIKRIKNFIDKNIDNLKRIFSDIEIDYSNSRKNKYQHFATRFAGKEAVIKAFNDRAIKLRDIEIINDKKGNPFVKIYDKKYSLISNKISISLSHSRDFAVAFVIIE